MTTPQNKTPDFTRLVFDSTVEGIWTIGLDGLITMVNKSAVQMFGYKSADQMVGLNSHELVHYKRGDGSPYPMVDCPIYKAFQKGVPVHLEDEVLWRADGTFFHADYRSVPILNGTEILGAVVTFVDNTEKRALEARVRSESAKAGLILEQLPMAFFTVSNDWKITYVNPAGLTLFQMSLERALGKNLWNLFPQLEESEAGTQYRRAIANRMKVRFELYYPPFDRWYNVHAYPHGADGLAVAFLETTEQKQVELRLTLEQRTLENIFALSPAGIALMRGPSFIFDKVNSKWNELVSPRDYIGKTWSQAYPEVPDSPLPAILSEVFETGVPFRAEAMEIRVEAEPGHFETRHYDFSYFRILDGEGKPYGIFCQCSNVTQLIQDKTDLEKLVEDLHQERDLREHFVASLSHDLRTPLNAAKMTVQMLGRKLGDPVASKALTLRTISNLNRAEQMIRDLLDANRIKAGEGLPATMALTRLDEVAKQTVTDLEELYGKRFKLETDGEVIGHWDCSNLQRVIENLAGNAAKYSPVDSLVTISIQKSGDDTVGILVHNEGNPIPPADQKILFQPWKRANAAAESQKKGWGMGLALVKGIAEAHGGTAHVESSEVLGTIFTVEIPVDSRGYIRD